MAKNKELRTFAEYIKRSKENNRMIEGCAVVFNSPSQDMGFFETIEEGAITEETIRNSDIYATLEHDKSRGILARSRYGVGSLKLELRDNGLYYSFEAPHTQLGDELLEYISRGEITTSSFAFVIDQNDGEEWYRNKDNQLCRKIKKIHRLYDVSPVFEPAYLATSVTTRKLEEINNLDEKLDALKEEIVKI